MTTTAPRILIPRGGSWGRDVAAEVRAHGGMPVIAPLVDMAGPADATALQAALNDLRHGDYDALAVTSATTVRVMTRWNAAVPESTAIAAVGPATEAALRAAGYPVAFTPAQDRSAQGLVDAWPENLRGVRVLVLASALAAPTLADGLRGLGCDVTAVDAYRTVGVDAPPSTRAEVAAGQVDAILVPSGSVAAEVTRQFGELPETVRIAVIGPHTARDAAERGLRVDAVAAERSTGALVTAALAAARDQMGFRGPARVPDAARRAPAPDDARPETVPDADDAPAAEPTHTTPTRDAAPVHDGAAATPAHAVAPAAAAPAASSGRLADTARVTLPAAVAHPVIRPRRLRQSAPMRRLVAETRIHPAQLILPMFVREGLREPVAIEAMPGVVQHSLDSLRRAAAEAARAGVGGVMLFGVPAERDATGTAATDPNGILNVATAAVAAEVGDAVVVQTDLCLDEFTDHGHCGVLDADGRVDNDATLVRYAEMALAQAEAGSALLGLSGMMDGQVAAVRGALDAAGRTDTAILGYSAKYASSFYGPFREAVDSTLRGDRRTYQQDPANRREGLREATLDVAEGADVVMVKPAMAYLDVLADVAASSPVPVWAYQVSGEYAMICAAGERGWIDRDRAMREAVTGILRAGAGAVLTYAAVDLAKENA